LSCFLVICTANGPACVATAETLEHTALVAVGSSATRFVSSVRDHLPAATAHGFPAEVIRLHQAYAPVPLPFSWRPHFGHPVLTPLVNVGRNWLSSIPLTVRLPKLDHPFISAWLPSAVELNSEGPLRWGPRRFANSDRRTIDASRRSSWLRPSRSGRRWRRLCRPRSGSRRRSVCRSPSRQRLVQERRHVGALDRARHLDGRLLHGGCWNHRHSTIAHRR